MRKILKSTGQPAGTGSGVTGPIPDFHAAMDLIQLKWDAPTFFPAASIAGPPLHTPVEINLLYDPELIPESPGGLKPARGGREKGK